MCRLSWERGEFTAHSFCRSGPTTLVEAGIDIVGLCEAGMWTSLKIAEEYVENTMVKKKERVNMLDYTSDKLVVTKTL